MNKDFIPSFLEKGYELKKEFCLTITSCVNYTYYIVYKAETKDLLILKDTHACLATTPPEPKIVHLEDIYQAMFYEINHIEKFKNKTYDNYEYKNDYRNKEDYENRQQISIQWYQHKVDNLQDFIDTYLEILKNRYND